jgi:hypothetical protein
MIRIFVIFLLRDGGLYTLTYCYIHDGRGEWSFVQSTDSYKRTESQSNIKNRRKLFKSLFLSRGPAFFDYSDYTSIIERMKEKNI